MDPIRRNILATGAAATAVAAAPRVFAQTGQGGAAMSFYEKGAVRIHFEEAGSGFPLLLIAGGGLNSTISNLRTTRPSTRSRSSRQSTAASHRTCATPTPASPPDRLRSTGRGMHTPMTISA